MQLEKDTPFAVLDCDGVLTAYADGTSFMCKNPENYHPSPALMKRLIDFLHANGCGVVLATNWRKYPEGHTLNFFGKDFPSPLGALRKVLGEYIVGELPFGYDIRKSEALHLWFEDVGLSPSASKYVIFEDDLREGYQSSPLFCRRTVFTNPEFGLSDEDVAKANAILNS